MAVTYKGSNGSRASSTVTIPTHAVGDIIIIYCDSAGTVPSAGGTVPTWTSIINDSVAKVYYAVATATNHTSGTWTSASVMMSVVLSGQKSSPAGGSATSNTGSGTSPNTAPSITLSNTDGSSAILHFITGYDSATMTGGAWSTAPSGYTSRVSQNNNTFNYGYRLLTKDTTTSDGSVGQAFTGVMDRQSRASVEILAAPTSGFFAMF